MDRPRLLNRRTLLGLGAATAGSLIVPGCSRGRSNEPAPDGPAKFATGNAGGVYSMYGDSLAKLVTEVTGVKMQTVPTEGSVQNLQLLSNKGADLAFCLSDSAFDAYEGLDSFESGALRFTALARTYDNYVHVVVPTASPIDKISDLEGKVVSVGPKSSGTKVVADRILATANIEVKKVTLDLKDAVAALKLKGDSLDDPEKAKGGIDALIWSGGLPTVPIGDLQKNIGFRLVDIGSVAEKIALKRFGGYVLSSIPPSVYSLASSVPTLAVPNYLLARQGLPDSWAWWTLNTMFRRQNDLMQPDPEKPNAPNPLAGVVGALDARSAIATMPIPLHQAAERWYRQNHI